MVLLKLTLTYVFSKRMQGSILIVYMRLYFLQLLLHKNLSNCLRPYHNEYTRSRPITEVKHCRAGIVLGWGTAWELPVS